MAKILLVDDDEQLLSVMSATLQAEGFTIDQAVSGADGLQLLTGYYYDLAILDWNMPGMTGIELCQTYRAGGGDCPILFLTGNRDELYKITGLNSGADDYLCKPFSTLELVARIRTLLRRPRQLVADLLVRGEITLIASKRLLKTREKILSLSQMEFAIVELFFRHPQQIFSTHKIFELLWSAQSNSSEQTVRVHIRAIRKKLANEGIEDFVKSAKGGGYFIE